MSTTIRGPLPPRVYWTRRLVLLLLVVLVVALVGWVLGRDGDADAAAEPGTSSAPSGPPSANPQATAPATSPVSQPRKTARASARTQTPQEPVLAPPEGPCDPTTVDLKIEVADTVAGRPNQVTFLLASTDSVACTLAVSPDILVAAITSGDDRIWSSTDCPAVLVPKDVVVRPDPSSAYTFTWDGRRSVERCAKPGEVPKPGGYWVEAAFIGGEPHKAYFDLVRETAIPPQPKP